MMKYILPLLIMMSFANAAAICESERAQLERCRTVDHPGSSCPRTTQALNQCLRGTPSTNLGSATGPCASEAQAVQHCRTVLHPGSSCPQTTATLSRCLQNSASTASTPAVITTASTSNEPCATERAELNHCRTVLHPGSSCPQTTTKLNACLQGGSSGGGNCSTQRAELEHCRTVLYPGSICPRTQAKLQQCLNPASTGPTNGSIRCNRNNNQSELECMICNCYHEARGESHAGRVAIGKVVMTRRYTDRFPKTLCGVIYQESQFSWTMSSSKKNHRVTGQSYRDCHQASVEAMSFEGTYAVHYHANYVRPAWARGCPVLERIGTHIFYRDCDVWLMQQRNRGVVQ